MITNKNFSVAMQDDLAFDVRGRNLLLAKGDVLFGNAGGAGSDFQTMNEEAISTLLGTGKRFTWSIQRGDVHITVIVDSYDGLDDCLAAMRSPGFYFFFT